MSWLKFMSSRGCQSDSHHEELCLRLLPQTEIDPELGSGNAPGAFLQTSAPVLDNISGPMGAQFLSSNGLGFGNLIGRARLLSVPALDKTSLPGFGIARN